MHRGEKEAWDETTEHKLFGVKATEKSEAYFSLWPLGARERACVFVVAGWGLSDEAWKDYRSGNNFSVCMGNCCDLFR